MNLEGLEKGKIGGKSNWKEQGKEMVVESGERILQFKEFGWFGEGKNWREVRGTGLGTEEGGQLSQAKKAMVVGDDGGEGVNVDILDLAIF